MVIQRRKAYRSEQPDEFDSIGLGKPQDAIDLLGASVTLWLVLKRQEVAAFRNTRFSMKNSIMRSTRRPECPMSGPTCTSKLLPAFCNA